MDPTTKNTESISRDHVVCEDFPGLVTITGGKWTTYRMYFILLCWKNFAPQMSVCVLIFMFLQNSTQFVVWAIFMVYELKHMLREL